MNENKINGNQYSERIDKGIIYESLLEKNIQKIKYFADEENKALKKICSIYRNINTSYISDNSKNIIANIDFLENNIMPIYTKRMSYIDILNSVIAKYHTLSNSTIQIFDKGNNYE